MPLPLEPLIPPPGMVLNPALRRAIAARHRPSLNHPHEAPVRHYADGDARPLRNLAALRDWPLFVPAGPEVR